MSIFSRCYNFVKQKLNDLINPFFVRIMPSIVAARKIQIAHRWPFVHYLTQEQKNELLAYAVSSVNGYEHKVAIFIHAGADVNYRFSNYGEHYYTPLEMAASMPNIANVKALLKAGAKANTEKLLWDSIIFTKSIDLLQAVIHAGVNVNIKNDHYNDATPLILAAGLCTIDMVEALINAGADIHAKTIDGYTALNFASYDHKDDISLCLLNAMTQEQIEFEFNNPNTSPELQKLIMSHQIKIFQNDLLTQIFNSSAAGQKNKIFFPLNQVPIELLPNFFSQKYRILTTEVMIEIVQKTYTEYTKDIMAQAKKENPDIVLNKPLLLEEKPVPVVFSKVLPVEPANIEIKNKHSKNKPR